MSTESGIPDFRSSEGLYSKTLHKHFSPEEMVSHTSGWRKRIEDGGRIIKLSEALFQNGPHMVFCS